jgi:hypothetical protein
LKTSNRILTTFVVVLALLTVAIVIGARLIIGPVVLLDNTGPRIERRLTGQEFDKINIEGPWEVDVRPGPAATVVITGPDGLISAATLSVDDDSSLTVALRGGFGGSAGLHVLLEAPTLRAMRFAGAIEADVRDLVTDSLRIQAQGVSELRMTDSVIGELQLSSSGVAELDLRESLVGSAALDLSGVSDLAITMNGGSLTGRVSGAGDVRYAGDVTSVDLRTTPAVDVQRG